ncbi:hypothetical protein PENTCL1PPCAC_5719, partial [Pristionchus entomophagus]
MSVEERFQIAGGIQTSHKELSRLLKKVARLSMDEFENLEDEDIEYFGGVNEFVFHRLYIRTARKIVERKKAEIKNKTKAQKMLDYAAEEAVALYLRGQGMKPDEAKADLIRDLGLTEKDLKSKSELLSQSWILNVIYYCSTGFF